MVGDVGVEPKVAECARNGEHGVDPRRVFSHHITATFSYSFFFREGGGGGCVFVVSHARPMRARHTHRAHGGEGGDGHTHIIIIIIIIIIIEAHHMGPSRARAETRLTCDLRWPSVVDEVIFGVFWLGGFLFLVFGFVVRGSDSQWASRRAGRRAGGGGGRGSGGGHTLTHTRAHTHVVHTRRVAHR